MLPIFGAFLEVVIKEAKGPLIVFSKQQPELAYASNCQRHERQEYSSAVK
jgi:hypothetical protein